MPSPSTRIAVDLSEALFGVSTFYKTKNGNVPKNGRSPTIRPFPYNGIIPLELQNEVSRKREKYVSKSICLSEMAELFACLKLHDFNEKLCSTQANNLNTCYVNAKESRMAKMKRDKSLTLIPNQKDMSPTQTNLLLAKFKQKVKKL